MEIGVYSQRPSAIELIEHNRLIILLGGTELEIWKRSNAKSDFTQRCRYVSRI